MQPRDMTEAMFLSLSEHARQLFNELMAAANSAANGPTKAGYAMLQEGNQLPEPLGEDIEDAVSELKELGLDIIMSKGYMMRTIQIRGIRVQGNRGEAA